jgi:hypothetical protein
MLPRYASRPFSIACLVLEVGRRYCRRPIADTHRRRAAVVRTKGARPMPAPRRSFCLKASRRNLILIKLSGANFTMLFGAE